MIVYRKVAPLRIRRAAMPEPPFWAAMSIAPYGARRAAPIAVDYLDLSVAAAEKLEVTVTEHVRDELERTTGRHPLHEPVLIDAAEFCESVFRRGEEALAFCEEQDRGAIFLTSTRGAVPSRPYANAVIAIAAWPLELQTLEHVFANAAGTPWGVAVPVIFPVTTNDVALTQLAELAKKHGAQFLAPLPVDLDPTAKQALAQSLSLAGDDDTYATLFHADLSGVHVAAERRIGAIAAACGMADFLIPPRWERKSNWNAAVVLKLAASRMMAMDQDIDVATELARSAGIIAALEKPIEWIGAAASLAIIEGLDATSVEILTDWLREGRSELADEISEQWRSL